MWLTLKQTVARCWRPLPNFTKLRWVVLAFCGGAWNRKGKYKHGIIYFCSRIQEACGTIKRVKFQVKASEILIKKSLPGVSSSDVRHGKSKRLSSCCHVQGRRPRRPSRKTRGEFCFVATLTQTYKLNLSRSCLRLTWGRIRMWFFLFVGRNVKRIRLLLFFAFFLSQR